MSIEIFSKNIARHIDGVIKADDESSLRLELDEYVLTSEVRDRLEDFLEAYNGHFANGAWISGFFGSGKSHLLKMLAIVLEDRVVADQHASKIFLDKCADSPTLKGLLSKAVSIPSKSILFNIDQKADIITNSQDDAVLSVFLKVFNESCGYYAKQPYIAQLERDLDLDDVFDKFQTAFQSITGKDWKTHGRSRSARFNAQIDQAYQQATGSNKVGVIDYYSKNYKVSIDDFANLVNDYIKHEEKSRPGFRLNFFVDEVGQYVANNVKLMTNVQTIAESLNTVCKMHSWLIVTSQSNVSDIVGEMTRQSGNDFSKIEGRFSSRLSLSGKNADEVIRRRLLEKKPDAMPALARLYKRYENDFKTMFDFADGSKRYACYADEDAFISCYPFVPYQFDLFQTTMINLSAKDAFTGRYTAIGERSMLAVCQDAAKKLCMDQGKSIGAVVPFDYWYDGIRLALKPAQINQIIIGEHNLSSPLEIRLLKVLFLVKYVREFKATARNLSILLIDDLSASISVLRKSVEEALAHLEQESYLQRVGDCYEYLTDEEKDIDKEIKELDIPPQDIEALYHEVLFDSILAMRRIPCSNGSTYGYISCVDGHQRGHAGELTIHFITPLHPSSGKMQDLRMLCLGKDEVMFVLPPDPILVSDIAIYKKTDRYLRQNPAAAQLDSPRKRLLEIRGDNNRNLRARIETRLRKMVSDSTVFISGDDSHVASTDPQGKIKACFDELATRVYSSRGMVNWLDNVSEKDISKFLKKDVHLPGMPDSTSEAELDILGFIQLNDQKGLLSTMKTVTEHFEGKPYGWPLPAIECLIARLWANSRVEATLNSVELNESQIKSALLNTHEHPNLVLKRSQEFTPAQIRLAKDFFKDFFNEPIALQDAKSVGEQMKKRFGELAQKLKEIAARKDGFPFAAQVEPYAEQFDKIANRTWGYFFSEDFVKQTDSLLDAKDKIIDPICKVFSSGKEVIYSEARRFYDEQKQNFAFMKDALGISEAKADEEKLVQLLHSPDVYKNAGFQQLKALKDGLAKKLGEVTDRLLTDIEDTVRKQIVAIEASSQYQKALSDIQKSVDADISAFIETIRRQTQLPSLDWQKKDFLEVKVPGFYSRLAASAEKDEGEGDKPAPKPAPVIAVSTIKPRSSKTMLENHQDVDGYLNDLRDQLYAEIDKGNKLLVNH